MFRTVHQNRKEIKEEIKLDKKDELYTSRFSFSVSENIIMCSYKAKKIKNVYLLSSIIMLRDLKMKTPKDALKQFYFIMKPKKALVELMKCSGAIQLKQRKGDGLY